VRKTLIGAAVALSSMCGVAHANSVLVQYFSVPDNGSSADFGLCCSSPTPATFPYINVGSALGPDGMPVESSTPGPNPAQMLNAAREILWWTPGQSGITNDGSPKIISTPIADNSFFVPQGTGSNNSSFFQTAILSGLINGTGNPLTLNITSDDDALVYLNGLFVGGLGGVHGAETASLNLGSFSGTELLQVFYADRAQTQAVLDFDLVGPGANITAIPEPSSWALMILGFMGVGFMAYRRKAHSSFRIA
jgi:hypothetical protein